MNEEKDREGIRDMEDYYDKLEEKENETMNEEKEIRKILNSYVIQIGTYYGYICSTSFSDIAQSIHKIYKSKLSDIQKEWKVILTGELNHDLLYGKGMAYYTGNTFFEILKEQGYQGKTIEIAVREVKHEK
jgi:histidyl-tRNA synthetase